MRIEVNRCECDNRIPVQKNDSFKSIVCENCMEVISYEKPDRQPTVRKSSGEPTKKSKQERKAEVKDILLPSEEIRKPKIYDGIEANKIYNEDCLLTMNKMKDGVLDYVFTSPPYNISQGSFSKYKDYEDDMSQQEYLDWSIKILDSLIRVTSKHVFYNIQCLANNKIALLSLQEHYKYKLKDILIWCKTSGSQATNAHVMSSRWEYIFAFSNQKPLVRSFDDAKFSEGFSNVIQIKHSINKHASEHKAVFPLNLPRKFIQKFGKEGDLWYDPFMGTGTTAKACLLEGRKYVGSEMSKRIYNIALKEIKQTQENPTFDFLQEVAEFKKPKVKAVDEGGKHKQILMDID